MREITLVTAFFNIGREKFKAIPRTDDTYMKNFKFWARMKNKLIVYTDENTAKLVLKVRTDFGLKDKTEIIIINDIFSIEPEIFENMKKVSENNYFLDFRILPNATSNIAEYSYLMLLKSYFLSDAVKRGLTASQVAWIDFGFNHGGDLYINPEEFNYLWEYDFSDKINMFYYKKYDEKPIFEIVRRLCDCIMGCLIVLPAKLCDELWQLNKSSMIILNKVGLSDDDQLIQLMSYREKPEIFDLHESEWFLPLKEYGGEHLTVRNMSSRKWYIRKLRNLKFNYKKRKNAFVNSVKTYNNLVSKE
ncbi:hypothetical protein KQH81_02685 [Clostridium cadaveris]|uniref:WlaTC/HtrL family glycosyltransferase n=1 Tax=Clostridium cadaveris TaxID=1529 RepID=UPI001E345CFA|nr:WlaTC/HtrL family glycosyltransferase [Clostridium cadaveris]UFH65471.1 hypothetical protein KQH81_02685 [Clostridium cadaveris]